MVPSQIGKYEIIAPIGRGSMGEVFKARDTVIGRHVALKTMSTAVGGIAELRQRFQREAQSAGRLNHPNIVTVYDFGEDRGRAYLAMELLEGRDLKELIARQEPVTLSAQLGLIEQICDGLAFAHARDVIHRDLKPANIHVLADGHVKIMDFGLARPSTSNMTQAGVMLGTPHYMSPEQVRGEKADARSDVFSLGVVFYELLARRKPFEADSMHSVLLQVLSEEPAPLTGVVPGIPARLAEIVEQALAKDPARRFRDAGEMRDALRPVRAAVVPEEAAGAGAPLPFTMAVPLVQLQTATVRVPVPATVIGAAPVAAGGPGRPREGAARERARWRDPALAGAALLTLAVLLLAVPVVGLGRAALHLAASPTAVAGAAPARMLNAIASSLPETQAVRAANVEPLVAQVQTALDKGDASAASRELDRLLAADPANPSLPALAARLEGLLMARVEQASKDLALVQEAQASRPPASLPAPAKPASAPRARRVPAVRSEAAPRPGPEVDAVEAPASTLPRRFVPQQEEPLVRRAVKDLEQALEERDIKKLRILTPALSAADERAIEASAWRGVRVAITGVDIQDSRANVQVLWSLRSKEGTVSTVRRTLGLERSVSGWKIASVGR